MYNKPLVKEAILMSWNLSFLHSSSSSVSSRFRQCKKALSKWKKDHNANSKVWIIKLQDDLELEQSALDPSYLKIASLKKDLLLAYRDEKKIGKKSNDWILYGDGNTKIFHAAVKISRAKN